MHTLRCNFIVQILYVRTRDSTVSGHTKILDKEAGLCLFSLVVNTYKFMKKERKQIAAVFLCFFFLFCFVLFSFLYVINVNSGLIYSIKIKKCHLVRHYKLINVQTRPDPDKMAP